MKGKCIMVQGTGSAVGKSILVTALCRILKQDGKIVAPFKSQNMALNSFITAEGLEMGRAQVAQAEACGLLPSARMNPILLKPTTDKKAQVILKGKVYKNMSAVEYHEYKPHLADMVREEYNKLENEHDVIVIEGAGSPAEINLRDKDLVNMGMAEIADAPVIIAGDIDKGGVFASLAGTMMLLTEEERARVKGVIINKFRGDVEILKPGIKMLEDIIKVPVLGVVPYININIEDEDSVTETFQKRAGGNEKKDIVIQVVRLPHISNFTDFNVFANFPDVDLRYVNVGEHITKPDILILPGSKNTIDDLLYLRESGLEEEIKNHVEQGKMLIGICGGYQMLGSHLYDPYKTESDLGEMPGLGLLDMTTTFEKEKVTTQVRAQISNELLGADLFGEEVRGYEIHMGINAFGKGVKPFIEINERLKENIKEIDGVMNKEGNVFGSYIHGIFDNTSFTRKLLNKVRIAKGLAPIKDIPESFQEFKEKEYDRLALFVRQNLDMEAIYKLIK